MRWNKKASFIIFKGLSIAKNCLRLESAPLKLLIYQNISCHWSLFNPPENTRKSEIFLRFQRVWEDSKWIKFDLVISSVYSRETLGKGKTFIHQKTILHYILFIVINKIEVAGPFHATGFVLYTLKTSQNQRFFDVFRGYRKKSVAWNGLYGLLLDCFDDYFVD